MSNIAIFRNHLERQNVYMEEVEEEDGGTFFRTRQNYDNGATFTIVVAFDESEAIVDLQVYGIANIQNPLKREAVRDLLNDLNSVYRYAKFYEIDGSVSAQYSIFLAEHQLDPIHLTNALIALMGNAEESYPKFMKLQWA